ncbi:MAG: hypothetical protein ACYDAR_17570 [Thermomicrobiales bacterium]
MASAIGLAIAFLAFSATSVLAAGPTVSISGRVDVGTNVNVNVGGALDVKVNGTSTGATQTTRPGGTAVNVNVTTAPSATANSGTTHDVVDVQARVGGDKSSQNTTPVSASVSNGGSNRASAVNASVRGDQTAPNAPAVEAQIATGLGGNSAPSAVVQAGTVQVNSGAIANAVTAPRTDVKTPVGTTNATSGTQLTGGVLAPQGTGAAVHNQTTATVNVPQVTTVAVNACVSGAASVGGPGYATDGRCEGTIAAPANAPISAAAPVTVTATGPAGTTATTNSNTVVAGGVLGPNGTGVGVANQTTTNATVPGVINATANLCLEGAATLSGSGYDVSGQCGGSTTGTPGAPISLIPVVTGTVSGPAGVGTTVNSDTTVVGGILNPVHGTGGAVGTVTTVGLVTPTTGPVIVNLCRVAEATLEGDGYTAGTRCGESGPVPGQPPTQPVPPIPTNPVSPVNPGGPSGPFGPTGPVNPTGPTEPLGIIVTNPTAPLLPLNPILLSLPTGTLYTVMPGLSELVSHAGGMTNGYGPGGPTSGSGGSSTTGGNLYASTPGTANGAQSVLPQTGHARPRDPGWTVMTALPFGMAAVFLIAGFAFRRRALRLR